VSKKRKRRKQKASTPTQKGIGKDFLSHPYSKQQSKARFTLPFRLTWKLISAGGAIVSFLSAVFLLPHVSVEPGATLDSSRPFETRFVLQNEGITPIQDVRFVAMWAPSKGEKIMPGIDAAGADGWTPVPKLSPFEKWTFGLNFGPYTNVGGSALVEIGVIYRPAFWFHTKTTRFNFVVERDTAGQYHWSPVGGTARNLHIKGDDW